VEGSGFARARDPGKVVVLRLPQSRRKRRRLLISTIVAGAAITFGLLFAFLRNTGFSLIAPTTKKPTEVVRTPKTVKPSPADRRQARRTLTLFVHTAVIRVHLAEAWPLVTPEMRADTSRAEWMSGTLPVVPYPADQFGSASIRPTYSYKGVLGYDVLVVPKTVRGKQVIYGCELHRVHGRWLVDFCYPRTTL
jgi:hypothetical protein